MPTSLDDLVAMAVFVRVVEARSFTRAAEQLALSKSAVSTRVTEFETRLGVRLLVRTTRSLSLTAEGLRVYERCKRMLAAADDVRDTADGMRGVLRVAAPASFGRPILAPALARFRRSHPALRVELVLSDRMVDVVAEGVDVAIRVASHLRDSSLVVRRIGVEHRVMCASPDYLARRGEPSVPGELVHHEVLRFTPISERDEWSFPGPNGALGLPVHAVLAADDVEVLRCAAVDGLGILAMPLFVVAEDLAAGRLRLLFSERKQPTLGIYAVHPPGRIPDRTRAFVEGVARQLRPAGAANH
jgi:DNA-binding transcriptional LysR family regulator